MIDRRKDREWLEQERVSVARVFQAIPPNDVEAEKSVLGSIMLANEAFDDVQQYVPSPDRFYVDAHKKIFAAIMCIVSTERAADAVTVANEMLRQGTLEDAGGPAYILQVLEAVPHADHAEYYAKIVADKWRQRGLIDACADGMREAFKPRDDIKDVFSAVESKIRDLGEESAMGPISYRGGLDMWVDSMATEDGRLVVPTGFKDLDSLLQGGLRGTQLAILAARPSVGKSALAGNIGLNVALTGQKVLMVVLEQTINELIERLLSAHSRVDHSALRMRRLNDQEEFLIGESAKVLREIGLYFDQGPRRSVADIHAMARRQKRKHGLDLLIVDYLQLVQPEDPRAVREQQVAALARSLKFLAKDLDIPVLCLAQLNRALESREDKKPRLSDLRESGAIEQDADVVMFIDRPHVYDPDAHPADAVLHVPKNRSGQPGKVDLVWRGNNLLFLPKAPFDPGGF